jgi:drug/metabolite transporter (DMT)-like permease
MWIPITIAAATFQILRTSQQHRLRDLLSPVGAGFVRYLYGAPLAIALAFGVFVVAGRDVPGIPLRFWPIVTAAGVAQILGTIALLHAFRARDFAIGTVYAKTEVIQVAVFAAVIAGEPLALPGWIGVVVCLLGVAWLASGGALASLLRRVGDPAARFGVAAGAGFALAAVGIREASRSLGEAPTLDRAVLTLAAMLTIQLVLNGTQLAVTDRAELGRTLASWRREAPVGLLSLAGSLGWALAVTLESAAKVRTLGQVEMLLAFAIGWRMGERHRRDEYLASAGVLVGILVVVVLG